MYRLRFSGEDRQCLWRCLQPSNREGNRADAQRRQGNLAGRARGSNRMSMRRAVRDRLLSRPAVLAAHTVALVVLSRLLTPTEFGLFALASVAYQIAVSLADLGIKTQLLKSTTLAPQRHGEAMGLAMVSALAVGMVFLAVVRLLPDQLVPPALDQTLFLLAASIILGPLDLLFNIPLMQGMRFGLFSLVNVAGAWTRCLVSIGAAALLDAGPAALAAGVLAEQLVSFALFALASRGEMPPRPRMSGWLSLIADGGRLGGGQVVRNVCELVMMSAISGFLGAAVLGVYNRATRVVRLFDSVVLNGIEPVVLPAFAQVIARGDAPASIYLRKVELLAALTWPAFAVIALLADPLCRVVLGPGWGEAVVIVQLLALTGIAKPFSKMSQTLFIALGEVRLGTRLDIQHHLTGTALASLGAVFSLEAACLGLLAAQIVNAGRQTRAFKRATGYDPRTLRRVLVRAAALTASAAGPAAAMVAVITADKPVLVLAAAMAAAGAGFGLAAIAMRHTLAFEVQRALKRAARHGLR